MSLHFEDACNLLRKTERQMFEEAYLYRYGRKASITRDLLTYQVAGILPDYVKEYLQHVYRR